MSKKLNNIVDKLLVQTMSLICKTLTSMPPWKSSNSDQNWYIIIEKILLINVQDLTLDNSQRRVQVTQRGDKRSLGRRRWWPTGSPYSPCGQSRTNRITDQCYSREGELQSKQQRIRWFIWVSRGKKNPVRGSNLFQDSTWSPASWRRTSGLGTKLRRKIER